MRSKPRSRSALIRFTASAMRAASISSLRRRWVKLTRASMIPGNSARLRHALNIFVAADTEIRYRAGQTLPDGRERRAIFAGVGHLHLFHGQRQGRRVAPAIAPPLATKVPEGNRCKPLHFAFAAAALIDLNQTALEIARCLELADLRGGDPKGPSKAEKRNRPMRPVIKLALIGMTTFAVAFAIRRFFFWDVMPLPWTDEPSSTGALVACYLLPRFRISV